MNHKKIVIIEKDKILKSILELFVEQLGHEIVGSFFNFRESLETLKKQPVEILLIDLNGFENPLKIKDDIKSIENFHFPTLFIGNAEDIEIAKKMIGLYIYAYMSKPISKDVLKINIDIANSKHGRIAESEHHQMFEKCKIKCNVDQNGHIVEYSPLFPAFFTKGNTDILGIKLCDIFNQDANLKRFEQFAKSAQENESSNTVFQINDRFYEAFFQKKSNVLYTICFRQPIFEKELVFKSSLIENQFQSLFNHSRENLLFFDINLLLSKYNNAAKESYKSIMGKELYTGMSLRQVLHFLPQNEYEHVIESVKIPAEHILNRIVHGVAQDYRLEIKVAPIVHSSDSSFNGVLISTIDLSYVNRLEKEIISLKDELKPVYESTIQRFYLTDSNKKILAFNNSALKIIQMEFNHTLKKGDDISRFVPKEVGLEEFDNIFSRALKGEHISFKTKIVSSIGEYWNEVHYEPVINENGDLNRVLIWTLDITDSEKNLIALNESNQRYELVAKGGNDGLWDWNLKNNEVYFSPRWKNLLGYDEEEIENEYGVRNALTHPDDRPESERHLKQSLEKSSDIFQNEIRLLCKDKQYKWVLERGIILRDQNNKPYRMAGSITDITDRKETEVALLQLNRSLLEERAMFIKGHVGIIRVNAQDLTKVSYVSENSVDITGYTPREFYTNKVPLRDIIHPEDKFRHKKERDYAIEHNQTHIDFSHYRLIKKNGSVIWVKDFTTILKDENGHVKDLLGYFIDISDSKKVEIEYEQLQSMFSAIWNVFPFELFIVQSNGRIVFSRNQNNYNLAKLVNNEIYIQNIFHSVSDWTSISHKVLQKSETVGIKIQKSEGQFEITFSKIDQDRILVSSNIPF